MWTFCGNIASVEYRALGLTTALSPQIDLATDPRWSRFSGTFGISPELSTGMAEAYIDGFQTSSIEKKIKMGWGYESVNAMAKHWPGGELEKVEEMLIMVLVNMQYFLAIVCKCI